MTIAPKALRARRPAWALPALAGCLAAFALPATGCGSDDSGTEGAKPAAPAGDAPSAKRAVSVNIANFKFMPASIKVRAGGTVTFVNKDKAPHTAQTDLGEETAEFNTDRLDTGDKKAVKLKDAGRFEYFCVYHRFMEGTIEVVE